MSHWRSPENHKNSEETHKFYEKKNEKIAILEFLEYYVGLKYEPRRGIDKNRILTLEVPVA